jgi:hypothetical protein
VKDWRVDLNINSFLRHSEINIQNAITLMEAVKQNVLVSTLPYPVKLQNILRLYFK